MRSEVLPTKVDTVEAFISPEVFSSRILSKEASINVSEMVTASFPNPLIPLDP